MAHQHGLAPLRASRMWNSMLRCQHERSARDAGSDNAKLLLEASAPHAGIPYALAGVVYVLVASRWLLVGDQTRRHSDLLFVARVGPGSPAVGNTVRGAGLKRLDRLFLVAVQRQVGLPGPISCSST